MAAVCANCAKSIGFFTRRKVELPDGSLTLVCRACARELKARAAWSTAGLANAAASAPTGATAPGSGASDELVPPRRFRADRASGSAAAHQQDAHPYRAVSLSDALQQQLDECRHQLASAPREPEPYRELFRLHQRHGRLDGAWCAASVLCLVDQANDEERGLFEQWRPRDRPAISGRLAGDAWWEDLCHEDEDWYVGQIFACVALAALEAKVEALEAKQLLPVLAKKHRLDPATSTLLFGRAFHLAAQVLRIAPPALYGRSDVPGELAVAPVKPPASIAGAGVLQGRAAPELAFIAGQHLAMYRSEHYVAALFPTATELRVLLAAAIHIVAPEAPVPNEIATPAEVTARELAKHLTPVHLEQLRRIVKMHRERATPVDVGRWVQLVRTTAARAGLLLCADLAVAQRVMMSQPQVPGDVPVTERLDDLLRFVVSDSYTHLRAMLGISVGEPS